jgi:hypothetical protein
VTTAATRNRPRMTAPVAPTSPRGRRARRSLQEELAELEAACARCDHQNAGHTRGGGRDAWWQATGACAVPGCPCPERTNDPAAAPTRTPEAPRAIVPPPCIPTRLSGPCCHGTGPCGATPTRPFPVGPLCGEHAPVAITRSTP